MKRIPSSFIILLLAFCLPACKSKTGLFIPADAVAVFHVSPASLSSKLSWEDIKNTTWFKDMHQQTDDTLTQSILNHPEASGVDIQNDFFFFMAKRGTGSYTVFEGGIKDEAAFEAANKKWSKKEKVDKDGDWNTITLSNSSVVAWSDKKFAYINNAPAISGMGGMTYGSQNLNSRISTDSLQAVVKTVLSNEGNSLTDDDRFESLLKEKGDMHFWLNSNAMLESSAAGVMSMMKISSLIEGSATGATINFDDGKVTVKTKSFTGKEMQKLIEKYDTKNISADLLNRIPSQNVIGVMAYNMNPLMVKDIFKAAGLDGLINMAFSGQQFTIDDIFAATGGQTLVAVSDVSMKDTLLSFGETNGMPGRQMKIAKPDYTVLFASSVNQKPAFQKLLSIGMQKLGTISFPYQLTDKWFAAGNKQAAVDAFLSGTMVKQAWADKLAGHPFGLYIDIQKILRSDLLKDSSAKAFMADAANVWQDVVATGGEYKNGVGTSEFVINMVDKKANSLKQLNAFIEKANAFKKNNAKKMMEQPDEDGMEVDSLQPPVLKAPPAANPSN